MVEDTHSEGDSKFDLEKSDRIVTFNEDPEGEKERGILDTSDGMLSRASSSIEDDYNDLMQSNNVLDGLGTAECSRNVTLAD